MSHSSHDVPPPVNHLNLAPVIIVGHGSSGTSITSRLLRQYLKVSFGTESQFIPRYYYRLSRYGDLNVDENLRRLISEILEERWFLRCRKFGFQTNLGAVFADVGERSYRGVLDSIFSQLAKHNRMVRWGDKTPEYIYHLPVLKAVLPNARYIHIIRDGRDVALSVFERFWGAKNIVTAALEWRFALERVREFAQSLGEGQVLDIRYEDLLTEPRQTFARIMNFIHVDDAGGRLLDFIEQHATKELKTTNFDKWKAAFSEKQQFAFDRVCGDLLLEYGYETRTTDVRQPAGWERAFWSLDSRFRQWSRLDYWKDDLYKLELRTKQLKRSLG
ncbi:MAG TPA: sulfotransferase [Planctomycetaceae bacterium]|nr:sulfotransferase [Planctomycetaceae bacterium]